MNLRCLPHFRRSRLPGCLSSNGRLTCSSFSARATTTMRWCRDLARTDEVSRLMNPQKDPRKSPFLITRKG